MSGVGYVLLGPPGGGKGTQASLLARGLNAVHLSTGEMLRAAVALGTDLGQHVAATLAAGQLVADDVMVRLVEARLAEVPGEQPIIFDGFPRTHDQAGALDALLARQGRALGAALLMEVPRAELVGRLMSRGRYDDTPAVVEERIEIYERETLPLRAYYSERGLLRVVDGSGTVDEVTARLLEAIEQQISDGG